MGNGTHVQAIHRDGMLELLTPLELPEGARVDVIVVPTRPEQGDQPKAAELVHPTRLVPAKRLDRLTGLVEVGGDAVAESEALYD